MGKVKKEHIFLLIILFIGFILRLWGINFGLPYQFHQDEPIIVNHALAYGTGDFNPHFFAIPPLASYILFFIYAAYFFVGKIFGLFATTNDFAISFLNNPTTLYILGRLFLGVIPGTLCILFTYKLYKKIFSSKNGALFSSGLVAFSFLNVTDSHYIYTDMLMSLFILLAVLKVFTMYKNPTFKNYILSAALIGVSISIKYNAAILFVPFVMSHLILSSEKKGKIVNLKIIFALICALLAFLATNPFILLDFKFFINSVVAQGRACGYVGFIHHIKYSLSQSVGFVIVILGLAGFFITLFKNTKVFLLLYSFPVVFYIHLVFFSQPFPRYSLSLIPFFAVSSSWFLFDYLSMKVINNSVRIIILVVAFLLFVPLLFKAIYVDKLFVSQDTRIESAAWINKHLRADDRVAVDHTFFRPAINQNPIQTAQKVKLLSKQQGLGAIKSKKVNLTLQLPNKTGYYIYFLSNSSADQGQFLSTAPAIDFDINALKQNNIQYVIVNYANRQKGVQDFYSCLRKNSELLASFSPYKDKSIRFSYDMTATTSMPLLSHEIYSRAKSGPALEIYKLKK